MRGLRFHLLMLVLLASVPAFLLVAGLSVQRRAADAARVHEDAVRVAMLASSDFENWIVGTRNLLIGLAQVPDVQTAGPTCEQTMRSVHEQSPGYTVMGVALPDGRFVCSSIPSPVIDLSDRRHFRAAVDGKVLGVGDFVVGRTSGRASLNLAQPILDDAGDVQAVVIAAIDLEVLGRVAARASLPDGSTLKVLDSNGTILALFPEGNGSTGQSIGDRPLFAAIAEHGGRGAADTTGLDGRQRLYSFVPLTPNEARSPTVVVGIPSEVAYGPANAMLAQGITALVFIGGLALVVAWLSGETMILRRVDRILGATRRLAAGDLEARTGVTSRLGELDELAQAFDVMADQLQRRDADHQQLERTLEEGRARLERESERLVTLHHLSARFSGDTSDVNTVLDEVLQGAVALVGAGDGATFHVWDEDAQALVRVRAWGTPAQVPSLPMQPGEGLVGRVFEAGEAIVVDDYPAWSGASRNGVATGVKRAIAAPLRYAGRRIGVLMIGSVAGDDRPFDADDVRLIGMLADQAAATLETTRLHVDLATQLARMHALTRLNRIIFATLDRETVLTEIAAAAATVFDVPFVAFWVLDAESQTLRPGAFSDEAIGAPLHTRTLSLAEAGFSGPHPDVGTHVEIVDPANDARIALPGWWRAHGLTTYYGVPIVGDEGALLGVLALYGREQFRFSVGDGDLLDSFVALAAVAVRNASLYQAESDARRLAELANRSKSTFLSRMSHELRTPLNAILGFAQIMQMSRLDERNAEAVSHILLAGGHLLALIDEVLDIERIETGRLSLTIEPVPLAGLVAELVDLVRPLAAGNDVHLQVADLSNAVVLADRQQLRQVLLNLLSNAIKYNRHGGSARLSYEHVDAAHGRIAVSDTGPGISADQMVNLFSPFDRLGAERTGVEGTGLGLTIAKSLAEVMGGKLTVASVVGQGTTFWVQLAIVVGSDQADTASAEVPVPELPATNDTLRRVLYVEDSRPNAVLVQRSLAWRPDVELLVAETAAKGLALARDKVPALILADLHLPDMSGAEMLTALRADAGTARIPVVIVSADASRDQVDRLLAAGARSYLTKPFDVRALLAVVDDVLGEAA